MQTVTLHTSKCFNLNHISLINVTLGSSYCQYFQCLYLLKVASVIHFIVMHCIVVHCLVWYCLYCIAAYFIVALYTALYCIVLFCIVLQCIALHCLAWHCIYCIAISQLIFVLILITKQTTADTATTEVIKLS